MVVYHKKSAPFLAPKHLALIGLIHEPPINWQQRHWQTLAAENRLIISFANGYTTDEYMDEALLNEAQRKAQAADLALLCVHTDSTQLPVNQHQLIRSVALVQPNVWVCMWTEGMVTMPWQKEAKIVSQVSQTFSELACWEEMKQQSLG